MYPKASLVSVGDMVGFDFITCRSYRCGRVGAGRFRRVRRARLVSGPAARGTVAPHSARAQQGCA